MSGKLEHSERSRHRRPDSDHHDGQTDFVNGAFITHVLHSKLLQHPARLTDRKQAMVESLADESDTMGAKREAVINQGPRLFEEMPELEVSDPDDPTIVFIDEQGEEYHQ